jgi:hypothetical protein
MLAEAQHRLARIRDRWPTLSPAARQLIGDMLVENHERTIDLLVERVEKEALARGRGSGTARAARSARLRAEDDAIRPEVLRLARRPMSARSIAAHLGIDRARVARLLRGFN